MQLDLNIAPLAMGSSDILLSYCREVLHVLLVGRYGQTLSDSHLGYNKNLAFGYSIFVDGNLHAPMVYADSD